MLWNLVLNSLQFFLPTKRFRSSSDPMYCQPIDIPCNCHGPICCGENRRFACLSVIHPGYLFRNHAFFSSAGSSGCNFYAMVCRPSNTDPKIAYDSSLISLEYSICEFMIRFSHIFPNVVLSSYKSRRSLPFRTSFPNAAPSRFREPYPVPQHTILVVCFMSV